MKNPPFAYARPSTLDEALALLDQHGDDAKVLAGGQSLLPILALRLGRPEVLVDIGRLPGLDQITAGTDGASIGALVRHADAEFSEDLARYAPLVHQAMPHVGHRAIRNRGTVVGSIAHSDAAAEMPAVCLAAGASLVAQSVNGERVIGAEDFFDGYLTTTLQANELVTEVRFPAWQADDGAAVVEVGRRHGDYALVGVACRLRVSGGTISEAALAFLGVSATPVRVAAAEAALVGRAPDQAAFDEAAALVSAELDPSGDVHGSTTYRKHLAGVLTRQGLEQANANIGVAA